MERNFDLVIVGGTIIDGTGSTPFSADVGIKDGAIALIRDLSDYSAKEKLHAEGAVVAPGFVDAHGHSDYTLLVDGRAVSQISQGVTTEVIGNCGHGCEPLTDDLKRFTGNIYGYDGSVDLTWRTTAEYLERLEHARPAINVYPLTPAGNVRRASIPSPDAVSPASADERSRMLRLIRDAVVAGSNGVSFGLEYAQEASASFEELVEQSKAVGELGGVVAVHTRDKDQHAVQAVEEAISIAAASGTPTQISHILPRRTAPGGSLDRIVDALGAARAGGLDVAFDIHTRAHGITSLSDCVSPEIIKNGPTGIRAALAERRWTEDVRHRDSIIHRFASSGWHSVQVFSTDYSPELIGMSIAEIALAEDCEPWEAVRRVLAATDGDVHEVMVVCDSYDEDDILSTATVPGCLIGSDATTLCPDGPLAGAKFLGAYTWAAWLYSRLTRSPRRLPVAQVVRKLAAEPAERFGLADRGTITVGNKADLAVFDQDAFSTEGSMVNPNVLATGVRHVTVNGSVALRDGEVTGNRPGQVLRRKSRGVSA